MGILVVLMAIAGLGSMVALFLGATGIVEFTTNQMVYLAAAAIINLLGVAGRERWEL